MPHHWTDAEKNFIRANAARLTDQQVLAALLRIGTRTNLNSLRKIRAKLGIKKRQGRGVCEVSQPKRRSGAVGLHIEVS